MLRSEAIISCSDFFSRVFYVCPVVFVKHKTLFDAAHSVGVQSTISLVRAPPFAVLSSLVRHFRLSSCVAFI